MGRKDKISPAVENVFKPPPKIVVESFETC